MPDPFDLLAYPPRVGHASRRPFKPGEIVGPHASESELFLPVLSGEGVVRVEQRSFALRTGQVLHVPWGAAVRYEAPRARPFVLIGVHLVPRPWTAPPEGFPRHESYHSGAFRALRPPPAAPLWSDAILLESEARLLELAEEMADVFEDALADDREPLLRALAIAFMAAARRARSRLENGADCPLAPRVRQAMAWLEHVYARPVRRAEIAARVGLGESALAAAFRAVTGRAPIDWLIDLRLAKARELLRAAPTPIARIGAAVGIADQYHFSKLFRRRIGCSPRQYRQRARL